MVKQKKKNLRNEWQNYHHSLGLVLEIELIMKKDFERLVLIVLLMMMDVSLGDVLKLKIKLD